MVAAMFVKPTSFAGHLCRADLYATQLKQPPPPRALHVLHRHGLVDQQLGVRGQAVVDAAGAFGTPDHLASAIAGVD